jgi:uncharacterized membrane protein YhiD involved in acid resistance
MLNFLDSIRGLDTGAIALRMLLSCLCGAVIGLERSAKNRPAGFRTHILVCFASNIAALTGLYLYLELKIPSDISRISAQVITGLGFLGAGTIVVTKNLSVKGLTTAAGFGPPVSSVWQSAAVIMSWRDRHGAGADYRICFRQSERENPSSAGIHH